MPEQKASQDGGGDAAGTRKGSMVTYGRHRPGRWSCPTLLPTYLLSYTSLSRPLFTGPGSDALPLIPPALATHSSPAVRSFLFLHDLVPPHPASAHTSRAPCPPPQEHAHVQVRALQARPRARRAGAAGRGGGGAAPGQRAQVRGKGVGAVRWTVLHNRGGTLHRAQDKLTSAAVGLEDACNHTWAIVATAHGTLCPPLATLTYASPPSGARKPAACPPCHQPPRPYGSLLPGLTLAGPCPPPSPQVPAGAAGPAVDQLRRAALRHDGAGQVRGHHGRPAVGDPPGMEAEEGRQWHGRRSPQVGAIVSELSDW